MKMQGCDLLFVNNQQSLYRSSYICKVWRLASLGISSQMKSQTSMMWFRRRMGHTNRDHYGLHSFEMDSIDLVHHLFEQNTPKVHCRFLLFCSTIDWMSSSSVATEPSHQREADSVKRCRESIALVDLSAVENVLDSFNCHRCVPSDLTNQILKYWIVGQLRQFLADDSCRIHWNCILVNKSRAYEYCCVGFERRASKL